jgi:hypothetical protein
MSSVFVRKIEAFPGLPGWSQVVKTGDTRGGLRPNSGIAAGDKIHKILAKPQFQTFHADPGA